MTPTKAEELAARLESGWCPIESPADMERAAAELRRLAAVEAERDALAARPAVPAGMVLVPVEVLEDAATAIGRFVSDHEALDDLDAYIARHKANAAPATPSPAPDCED